MNTNRIRTTLVAALLLTAGLAMAAPAAQAHVCSTSVASCTSGCPDDGNLHVHYHTSSGLCFALPTFGPTLP